MTTHASPLDLVNARALVLADMLYLALAVPFLIVFTPLTNHHEPP